MDRSQKHESGDKTSSPYGDDDTMLNTLETQLAKGPYILGERFTAADVLWGVALNWTTMFGLVEKTPDIAAYSDRVVNRPAAIRVRTKDAELAAEHGT